MNDWELTIEQIVSNISPEQLTRIVNIGQMLKKSLTMKTNDQSDIIKKAQKDLYEYFDNNSCKILMQIIGMFNPIVDHKKNQVDIDKLEQFMSTAEDQMLKNSGMIDYTDSVKKGELSLNWVLDSRKNSHNVMVNKKKSSRSYLLDNFKERMLASEKIMDYIIEKMYC
jgi:hypothetical protein